MDSIIDNLGYAADILMSQNPCKALGILASILAVTCAGIVMLCRHLAH